MWTVMVAERSLWTDCIVSHLDIKHAICPAEESLQPDAYAHICTYQVHSLARRPSGFFEVPSKPDYFPKMIRHQVSIIPVSSTYVHSRIPGIVLRLRPHDGQLITANSKAAEKGIAGRPVCRCAVISVELRLAVWRSDFESEGTRKMEQTS